MVRPIPPRVADSSKILLLVAAPWVWFSVRNVGRGLDAIATALPVWVAVVAGVFGACAAVRRSPRLAVAGVSWAAMGSVAVLGPWAPVRTGAPRIGVRVVHANVSESNPALPVALADVMAKRADVLVVTEATLRSKEILGGAFPHQVETGDQLVLSRFPLRLLDRPPDLGYDGERIEVATADGSFLIYPVHLGRPHLRRLRSFRTALGVQRRDIDDLLGAAAREHAPVVLTGDFNVSDRTRAYRRLSARFRDAMRGRWAGPTYVRRLYRPLLLRIDHLFVPRQWCSTGARRFRIAGSDHRGVMAEIGPCRS